MKHLIFLGSLFCLLFSTGPSQAFAGSANPAFVLQILHTSDVESGLAELENASRFSSVLSGLKSEHPANTVVLSSGGNWISGPFFSGGARITGTKGRTEVQILNRLGIQASVLGNHEMDETPEGFLGVLGADGDYSGTMFPYLAANLDFTSDPYLVDQLAAPGQEWNQVTNQLTSSTVITVAGQKIGIIGVTIPTFKNITSAGKITVLTNTAFAVQAAVDQLKAQSINKLILLSHFRDLNDDLSFVRQIRDIDVVIAGGSLALLARPGQRLRDGDQATGNYPLLDSSLNSEPVYIVNTSGSYKYVGRLVVRFDDQGQVTGVDDSSRVYPTDAQGVLETGNFPIDTGIESLVSAVGQIINTDDRVIFGSTSEYLQGAGEVIRSEESNLGDAAADADLFWARRSDTNVVIAFKNAGGIRDSIGSVERVNGEIRYLPPAGNPASGKNPGEISQLDIGNVLRFNNSLVLLTLTAQQVRDAVEWSVSEFGPPGKFPQIGGLAFSFDPARPSLEYEVNSNNVPTGIKIPGSRVRSLVVTNADSSLDLVVKKGLLIGDPARRFRAVAIEFLANGGDDYLPLAQGVDRTNLVPASVTNKVFNTEGTEQWAFAQYLKSIGRFGQPELPAKQDRRNQNLSKKIDEVLFPEFLPPVLQPGEIGLRFSTLPGFSYQLEDSENAEGPWSALGGAVSGTGKAVETSASASGRKFFRVKRSE